MLQKKKILLTNIIYGTDPYLEIFLNHHLKSMLDPSNIPANKDRIAQYVIYTDEATRGFLHSHPRVQELCKHIDVEIGVFQFPPDIDDGGKFKGRYAALVHTFKLAVQKALDMDAICSPMVADLIVAKDYLTKLISRFDAGYGAVFVLPMRTAYEALAPILDKLPEALNATELGRLGYENLHPLWTHSHWDNPLFTRQPFSLIWNSGTGLLVHSFAITPIAFHPTETMLKTNDVIDVEIPAMCLGPIFWATDWTDCPILGLEPLQCYYPPFDYSYVNKNENLKIEAIADWTKCLKPNQPEYLRRVLFYPNMKTVGLLSDPGTGVIETILGYVEERKKNANLRTSLG